MSRKNKNTTPTNKEDTSTRPGNKKTKENIPKRQLERQMAKITRIVIAFILLVFVFMTYTGYSKGSEKQNQVASMKRDQCEVEYDDELGKVVYSCAPTAENLGTLSTDVIVKKRTEKPITEKSMKENLGPIGPSAVGNMGYHDIEANDVPKRQNQAQAHTAGTTNKQAVPKQLSELNRNMEGSLVTNEPTSKIDQKMQLHLESIEKMLQSSVALFEDPTGFDAELEEKEKEIVDKQPFHKDTVNFVEEKVEEQEITPKETTVSEPQKAMETKEEQEEMPQEERHTPKKGNDHVYDKRFDHQEVKDTKEESPITEEEKVSAVTKQQHEQVLIRLSKTCYALCEKLDNENCDERCGLNLPITTKETIKVSVDYGYYESTVNFISGCSSFLNSTDIGGYLIGKLGGSEHNLIIILRFLLKGILWVVVYISVFLWSTVDILCKVIIGIFTSIFNYLVGPSLGLVEDKVFAILKGFSQYFTGIDYAIHKRIFKTLALTMANLFAKADQYLRGHLEDVE